MESPEIGNSLPETEPKERQIIYTYPVSDSNLDLFFDLGNHILRIEDEFPECEIEIIETEDDIHNERPMTLTIKLKATENDYNEIKKFLDENFAPSVFEEQNARIDTLLNTHK
ncbi:MAG: hypothetical protein UU31_C0006G0028 [Candidatus Uhrbacteria bacterium GW2011_GWA2_41_10]|uniref:Uncharacterized protein n=1 Tax=Candidatus Uhrbacteria bacterium GW2011_GWC2_41_11 TaxID=1618985 RepID=A0A0G0UFD7_9BACT|nr:MAG: hypothetical protein UU31_C0006G0028 [Candidatus Uhrbacteria bacterium GW2011_GWA2_41_10]KKR86131.1 MAG: hypothetical protein UU35_C0019G0011 [Candidatus Uhrbacteria bacterium GW2011_GWC2_41_11]HBP00296.1 hypothetical protein [Candidatus Uhrbacteria bacterium]